jgi:hypothetical protein
MKPVSSKVNDHPSKKGCNPISASCIVWEGPDIPCLKLCKGDTIDKVIYDLAKILCEITDELLDVSTLDFACLLEDGSCEPKTILETLQALIYKSCESNPTIINESTEEPILPLPECLHYQNNENDTVTQLLLSEYVTYLASKICEILLSITSIQATINNLNNRINEIEVILDGLGSGGSAVINITTQCLSSQTPGQVIPIEVAFQNLESALCNYIDTLGDISDWNRTFDNICIASTTPLPCGQGFYGDLPGWVSNPTTAAEAVNNLWIAMCTINDCVDTSGSGGLACSQLPPTAISVTPSNVQAFINVDAPLVPAGFENPTDYTITVYQNNFGSPGSQVATYTLPYAAGTASQQILPGTPLVEDEEYYIEVVANYSCGSSTAINTVSTIILGTLFLELRYSTSDSVVFNTCGGSVTALTDTDLTVTLYDLNTGNPTINGAANPIVTNLRVAEENCLGITTSIIPVSIPVGQSSGTVTIRTKDVLPCANYAGACTVLLSAVQCLDSVDYGGLSGVGLHTSMPPFC